MLAHELLYIRTGQQIRLETGNPFLLVKDKSAMSFAHQRQYPEKRNARRHKCELMIECAYFNQENYFDAKLRNFSYSGVYIETAHDLKPGCTILLKMTQICSTNFNFADNDRPRSVSLGEVKWRVDLSQGAKSYYGVGVRYPFAT